MVEKNAQLPMNPSLKQVKEAYSGNVLLLLLGRSDCPGTIRGTVDLEAYVQEKPVGVKVIRLDVPLFGESLAMPKKKAANFEHLIDAKRRVATELEFFYYPTFYVFDKDGAKRFSGGCDIPKTKKMVQHILEEKPGQEKKIWSPPMPAVGSQAPNVKATTVAGDAVDLKALTGKKGMLLLFSHTGCPFSVKALPSATTVSKRFADKGLSIAIVNQSKQTKDVDALYSKQCPGIPLIHDSTGICRAYGVEVAPFYFLIESSGKIVARGPYTETAATQSIQTMLGIKTTTTKTPATGAG